MKLSKNKCWFVKISSIYILNLRIWEDWLDPTHKSILYVFCIKSEQQRETEWGADRRNKGGDMINGEIPSQKKLDYLLVYNTVSVLS